MNGNLRLKKHNVTPFLRTTAPSSAKRNYTRHMVMPQSLVSPQRLGVQHVSTILRIGLSVIICEDLHVYREDWLCYVS